jgi:hypothetical protein
MLIGIEGTEAGSGCIRSQTWHRSYHGRDIKLGEPELSGIIH